MARVSSTHLTFGPDPATSMTVSWLGGASSPVLYAPVDAGAVDGSAAVDAPGSTDAGLWVPDDAERAAPTSSLSRGPGRRRVQVEHARLTGLRPGTRYRYAVAEDAESGGAVTGEFRTAPAPGGDEPFTFTCFGDHGTDAPDDPYGTHASRAVVAAVDQFDPLFHLALGDLSYASLRRDPPAAWEDWFQMISPSARRRPWMPVAGNHESERGAGKFGLTPYQAYFVPPANGAGADYEGLWYAFTVGRARFVMLFGEDVCYQDHGEVYLRGFSGGRQTAWLERTLREARADATLDWVIVGLHQVAVSTAAYHNGGDLGLREEWLPLFDRYGVDLVLCGHEHHYERTRPVRGFVPGSTELTPQPAVPSPPAAAVVGTTHLTPANPTPSSPAPSASAQARPAPTAAGPERVDTTQGTVHVTIGTGGSSSPSSEALLEPPAGRVVVDAEKQRGNRRRTVYRLEQAPWLAARSTDHPYAFAVLQVDPGLPGGMTAIRLAVHDTLKPDEPPFDEVILTRPRRDSAQA